MKHKLLVKRQTVKEMIGPYVTRSITIPYNHNYDYILLTGRFKGEVKNRIDLWFKNF